MISVIEAFLIEAMKFGSAVLVFGFFVLILKAALSRDPSKLPPDSYLHDAKRNNHNPEEK